jgi:hypothetical protein
MRQKYCVLACVIFLALIFNDCGTACVANTNKIIAITHYPNNSVIDSPILTIPTLLPTTAPVTPQILKMIASTTIATQSLGQ